MKVKDVINELSFQGSRCTKDCSGHFAGYKWAKEKSPSQPCQSTNPSFNAGCEIARNQIAAGKTSTPKVRDDKGRFSRNPKLKR